MAKFWVNTAPLTDIAALCRAAEIGAGPVAVYFNITDRMTLPFLAIKDDGSEGIALVTRSHVIATDRTARYCPTSFQWLL